MHLPHPSHPKKYTCCQCVWPIHRTCRCVRSPFLPVRQQFCTRVCVYVQTPERSRALSLPDNTGIVDDPFIIIIIILCVFVAIVIIVVRAHRYVIRGGIKRGRRQRQEIKTEKPRRSGFLYIYIIYARICLGFVFFPSHYPYCVLHRSYTIISYAYCI